MRGAIKIEGFLQDNQSEVIVCVNCVKYVYLISRYSRINISRTALSRQRLDSVPTHYYISSSGWVIIISTSDKDLPGYINNVYTMRQVRVNDYRRDPATPNIENSFTHSSNFIQCLA